MGALYADEIKPCGAGLHLCHHERKLCLLRSKHPNHDWVNLATVDIFHCPGRSFARKRCPHNISSNMQCLLKKGHKGDHNEPCTDVGRHRSHAKTNYLDEVLRDAKGRPYECGGRVFDQT